MHMVGGTVRSRVVYGSGFGKWDLRYVLWLCLGMHVLSRIHRQPEVAVFRMGMRRLHRMEPGGEQCTYAIAQYAVSTVNASALCRYLGSLFAC